jgi:hypothetical protein
MPSAVMAITHDRRVSIVAAAGGARPVAVTVVMAYEACHFPCKKQCEIKLQPLPLRLDIVVPALIVDLADPTAWRYLELTRIGLEAGPLSQWLHAGLTAAGLSPTLIETRHVKAALKAMTVKTDRNDARGMAQLMRMGWFRPVHVKTVPAQEIRALPTRSDTRQSVQRPTFQRHRSPCRR